MYIDQYEAKLCKRASSRVIITHQRSHALTWGLLPSEGPQAFRLSVLSSQHLLNIGSCHCASSGGVDRQRRTSRSFPTSRLGFLQNLQEHVAQIFLLAQLSAQVVMDDSSDESSRQHYHPDGLEHLPLDQSGHHKLSFGSSSTTSVKRFAPRKGLSNLFRGRRRKRDEPVLKLQSRSVTSLDSVPPYEHFEADPRDILAIPLPLDATTKFAEPFVMSMMVSKLLSEFTFYGRAFGSVSH